MRTTTATVSIILVKNSAEAPQARQSYYQTAGSAACLIANIFYSLGMRLLSSRWLLVVAICVEHHETAEAFAAPKASSTGHNVGSSALAVAQNVTPFHSRRSFLFMTSSEADTGTTAADPVNPAEPIRLPFQPPDRPASYYDTIIAGGGPAGLLAAIALAQKHGPDHKIAVCEQRAAIPPSPSDDAVWSDVARFYLLGIGHRGQTALEAFGVLDDFKKASVEVQGRRDWQPGATRVEDGRTTPNKKNPPSRVLARDKLVGVLHEHLVKNYVKEDEETGKKKANIDLLYGYQVEPLNFGTKESDAVSVRISKCEDVIGTNLKSTVFQDSQEDEELCDTNNSVMATTNFLIGADGAARTVANAMEETDARRFQELNLLQRLLPRNKPFKVTKFVDDNPRVYKSVPILLPPDWPRGLNYSARSRDSRVTLEALPSDDQGNLCALLLMKPDDELAQPNVDPAKLRGFFDEEFPQFGALVDDEEMQRVAQKQASRLPVFRFAGPRLNMGSRTLVLGDAAHTVKPYYGLGANTALEDVQVLSNLLDEVTLSPPAVTDNGLNSKMDAVPRAVQLFSKRRAGDSAALVTISRNMDRPGKLFFINFLLPLILDGIFHKMAPKIFGPNMFGMFQEKGVGFKQIQTKKRLDRALQLVCIGSLLTGASVAVKALVLLVARSTGKSPVMVTLGAVLTGMVVTAFKKIAMGDEKTATSKA